MVAFDFVLENIVGIAIAYGAYLASEVVALPYNVFLEGIISLVSGAAESKAIHVLSRVCAPLAAIIGIGYAWMKLKDFAQDHDSTATDDEEFVDLGEDDYEFIDDDEEIIDGEATAKASNGAD